MFFNPSTANMCKLKQQENSSLFLSKGQHWKQISKFDSTELFHKPLSWPTIAQFEIRIDYKSISHFELYFLSI